MAEFILKDWYGKDQVFDKETIYVQGKDGELMPFTHGAKAVIEPLEVTENGTYEVPEGVSGYSPVTVAVPIPEIKLQEKTITENGEYTADSGFDGLSKVIVALATSGGKTPLFKSDIFTASDTINTLTHGMGVIPDIICVYTAHIPSAGYLLFSTGFSQALIDALGGGYTAQTQIITATGVAGYRSNIGMEYSGDNVAMGYVRDVTTSKFTVGGSTGKLNSGEDYGWFAIAGVL